jgi:sigma-B regulation protein RsbU (phosphoserine phosphatase)
VESPAILQGGLIGLEPGQRFESGTFRLEPGDLLLCTSDGVLEAQNTREELYDEERARAALAAQPGKSAAATIEGILDDVARFTSGADPSDDITVLALKYLGPDARRQPTAPAGSKAAGPSEAGGGPRPPRGSR